MNPTFTVAPRRDALRTQHKQLYRKARPSHRQEWMGGFEPAETRRGAHARATLSYDPELGDAVVVVVGLHYLPMTAYKHTYMPAVKRRRSFAGYSVDTCVKQESGALQHILHRSLFRRFLEFLLALSPTCCRCNCFG